MSTPQITLHHLNESRSERLFWLLEELGLPYNVKAYHRQPDRRAPEALRNVTKGGKSPVVELDGELLVESGYIVHRLTSLPSVASAASNVELNPSDSSVFWSHWAEATQMAVFQATAYIAATTSSDVWIEKGAGITDQAGKEALKKYGKTMKEGLLSPQNQIHIDNLEEWLSEHPGRFLSNTDKPGHGDFMVFFAVHTLIFGRYKNAYKVGPHLQKYYEMVMSRPACQKAMERMAKEEATKSSL